MVRLQEARIGSRVLMSVVFVALMIGAGTSLADSSGDMPVYDLSQCIGIALDGSRSLAIADQNQLSAGHGVRLAYGNWLPGLSLSRTWQKSERTDYDYLNPFTGIVGDITEISKYKDYSASSDFYIFRGFRNFGDLKSAKNTLRAAQADQAYTRQQVIETVAQAYINLLRNERLLEVSTQSQDLAQREFDKAETYHRIGSAARSDVLQAQVRLGQTRLEVIRARNGEEQAFADLAHAMNRPLARRFDVDRSLLEADFTVEDLESLFDEAITQRADLQSRAYTVEAREGDVTSATSGLLPSLRLFGRYSRYTSETRYQFGGNESGSASWGYSVDWNIFDRFQTLSGRSRAKVQQRIAEYNLDQAQLDAQLEVRRLFNSKVEARERLTLSRETIANANEELRLAQERFKVGAGTMLEQITAQVNVATALSDEVQGLCDYLIATLQLDRSVGRALDGLGE